MTNSTVYLFTCTSVHVVDYSDAPTCNACDEKPASKKCPDCPDGRKFTCDDCRTQWHDVFHPDHSVLDLNENERMANFGKGRKALLPGALPRNLVVSNSKKLKSARKHDQTMNTHNGIHTLRLIIKRHKDKPSGGKSWRVEMSGSRSICQRFRRGQFPYQASITGDPGDNTKWVSSDNWMIDSPELPGGDPPVALGQQVSPAKNYLYPSSPELSSPGSSIASFSPGRDGTRSALPLAAPARNRPRRNLEAITYAENAGGAEEAEDREASFFVGLEGNPYPNISPENLGNTIWTFYPAWQLEKTANSRKELAAKHGFSLTGCVICNQKIRSAQEFERCIGVLDGCQCLRKSHLVCGGQLFLCQDEGCSSREDPAATMDLVHLFFLDKLKKLSENATMPPDVKQQRERALATTGEQQLRVLRSSILLRPSSNDNPGAIHSRARAPAMGSSQPPIARAPTLAAMNEDTDDELQH